MFYRTISFFTCEQLSEKWQLFQKLLWPILFNVLRQKKSFRMCSYNLRNLSMFQLLVVISDVRCCLVWFFLQVKTLADNLFGRNDVGQKVRSIASEQSKYLTWKTIQTQIQIQSHWIIILKLYSRAHLFFECCTWKGKTKSISILCVTEQEACMSSPLPNPIRPRLYWYSEQLTQWSRTSFNQFSSACHTMEKIVLRVNAKRHFYM